MTTINVPRELLADLLSLDREKRIPAERHLYALLTEQPQAGVGQDKWADYKRKFCGCKDASRLNSCRGLANCELPANHPERKQPPARHDQGDEVVMPAPLMAAVMRADDVLHALAGWDASSAKLEQRHGDQWVKEVDAIRRELHTQLARLNAKPQDEVKP